MTSLLSAARRTLEAVLERPGVAAVVGASGAAGLAFDWRVTLGAFAAYLAHATVSEVRMQRIARSAAEAAVAACRATCQGVVSAGPVPHGSPTPPLGTPRGSY